MVGREDSGHNKIMKRFDVSCEYRGGVNVTGRRGLEVDPCRPPN